MADETKQEGAPATERSGDRGGDRGGRGPRPGGPGGPGGREGGRKFFRRKKVCKFCVEKIDSIDYKDYRAARAVCRRERQDCAAPFDRRMHAASTALVDGDQAGAQYRPAAVCGTRVLKI